MGTIKTKLNALSKFFVLFKKSVKVLISNKLEVVIIRAKFNQYSLVFNVTCKNKLKCLVRNKNNNIILIFMEIDRKIIAN